jgi:FkbM family methyltransferase
MNIHQLNKYIAAIATPAFWPSLANGVMPEVEHIPALKHIAPGTLIDVGANKGQFSVAAQYVIPSLRIEAFEPLESESAVYKSVLGPSAKLHSLALGENATEAVFFVASRADSSSLLPPGEGQKAAYGVETKTLIRVPVARLSDVIEPSSLPRPILLKLDVQGGELDVLKGAERVLPDINYIYCEASFVRLYDGQPLVNEIITYLIAHGFALRGVFNQSVTAEFGPTQADFLFERT